MRKLKLNVDALTVESFAPSESIARQGTVAGHQSDLATCATCDDFCGAAGSGGGQTCKGWNTCEGDHTCNFVQGCYTFGGGWTCAKPCTPTQTCTQA